MRHADSSPEARPQEARVAALEIAPSRCTRFSTLRTSSGVPHQKAMTSARTRSRAVLVIWPGTHTLANHHPFAGADPPQVGAQVVLEVGNLNGGITIVVMFKLAVPPESGRRFPYRARPLRRWVRRSPGSLLRTGSRATAPRHLRAAIAS